MTTRTWKSGCARGLAVAALLYVLAAPAPGLAASSETYEQLELFGDIFERVRAQYVDEVDDGDLIESAINGMLRALDPHSTYLNAENFQEMQVNTRGSFGGLGIEVTMENGLVKVITPIDDTPAFRAGIQPGDFITHLDSEPVLGLTLPEAVDLMRGPINSSISLTVSRVGVESPLDIVLTRAVIKLTSVRWRAEGDAAYIRITSFSEPTFDDLEKAMAELKAELGPRFKGVILDLRNNPGGLLNQAVSVSNAFLDRGEIVSTRGRQSQEVDRYNATKGDLADNKPVIVLINGGSASAAEIVAGALQDHKRAIILGTPSFGKGSVQTVTPLGAHGALRLTTSLYYTPSGISIQAKGISPDITVDQIQLAAADAASDRRESSLRGHLPGDDEADETANAGELAEASNQPQDYQLARALDLLHGLSLFGDGAAN